MGITGELVRSVFSRSRSFGTHETTVRSNVGEKRRWSSVRSYLCGDELNSVLAEEDSASVKSSEATVTQPITEDTTDKEEVQNQQTKEETAQEKHNSTSNLFRQEDAAITIQSAFREFLARRRVQVQESKSADKKQELVVAGTESPSRESVGTSIEVQTGNSTEAFSVQEQLMADHGRIQQKARSQVLRLKEDWDDSTVSSNISRMRIQNRLEASTRRERALAYAFSQQLRICAKKKQARSDGTEANMGWNWLERWMATRIPDSPTFENHMNKQFEPINNNHGFMAKKRFFDITGEEKESCGSNEVFDSFSVTSPKERDAKPANKNRLKPTRSVSKRKTVPSNHCLKDYAKVSKNECTGDAEKHKRHKQKELVLKKDTKCSENSSEESPIHKSPDLL